MRKTLDEGSGSIQCHVLVKPISCVRMKLLLEQAPGKPLLRIFCRASLPKSGGGSSGDATSGSALYAKSPQVQIRSVGVRFWTS